MAIASCSCNNNKTESPSTAENESPQPEWDTLIAIQDCQQQMSAELFAGLDYELLNKVLPEGKADASINVFLLKGKNRTVLFDAGLGESRHGMLMSKLDSLGITPDHITDICITHFHGDHIGGLLDINGNAVFPKAKLYFSNVEYEAWTTGPLQGENPSVATMLEAYKDRYVTFEAGDTIIDGIVTIAAPGHTPGHTMFDTGNEIIVGDLLHAVALQVEHPEFSARYDYDAKLASETRIAILEKAKTTHKPLAGMHFPYPHFLKF